MRVLVVDQDSASNLAITRSLRDLYTVDCVTNKGDCLDLLRANTFEVIVATERLEDGSGLELLGQISKKWPSVLRIFAADHQRLQLLRGRLGPFELFQTLSYPIDPQRLMAALELAGTGQHPEADTSDTQQVESSGEAPAEAAEEADEASELNEPLELGQSDDFSEPRFARAGRTEPARAASRSAGARSSGRGGSPNQARAAPAQRPGVSSATAQRPRVSSAPSSGRAAGANAPRGSGNSNPSRSRRAEAGNSDLATKFPGSGTIGQRRPPSVPTGASQNTRPWAATNRAPPVRFPPLERTPPLERIPPLETPDPATRRAGEFSEAAAMARAARSNYEVTSDEFDTKRLATLIGGGVAIVAVVVFLGFKMFGSRSEAPKAAAPVATHAPEYPPEVTALVAQTEAAFKADDFKTARADVDKLRQLSPSHPRLDFLQGLLLARADSAGKSSAASGGHGATKKSGKSSMSGGTSPSDAGGSTAVGAAGSHSGASSAATVAPSTASSTADAAPPASTLLPTETPAGMTRAITASSSGTGPTSSSPSGSAVSTTTAATAAAQSAGTSAAATAAATSSAPPAAEAPHEPAATASPARRAAGEPPPVIQEAKLIRRVNPDYPSAAKKDGIAGSVDLDVTVSSHGVVEDVTVAQATPPDMFDKSAVAAVRKWKYDPRFVDGLPSQSHLKVHLDFGPNK